MSKDLLLGAALGGIGAFVGTVRSVSAHVKELEHMNQYLEMEMRECASYLGVVLNSYGRSLDIISEDSDRLSSEVIERVGNESRFINQIIDEWVAEHESIVRRAEESYG